MSQSDAQRERPRIFVVEDDRAIAELLRFYLEEAGHGVRLCGDRAELWQALEKGDVDLITLDLVLPDADGVELLEELRKHEKTRAVPIVVISVRESERSRVLAMGASAFIGKPLDEVTLKKEISALLDPRKDLS